MNFRTPTHKHRPIRLLLDTLFSLAVFRRTRINIVLESCMTYWNLHPIINNILDVGVISVSQVVLTWIFNKDFQSMITTCKTKSILKSRNHQGVFLNISNWEIWKGKQICKTLLLDVVKKNKNVDIHGGYIFFYHKSAMNPSMVALSDFFNVY